MRAAGLGMFAALAALAGAAPASAATYHAFSCRIPYGPSAGTPAPTAEVGLQSNSPTAAATSSCATPGGALTAALAGNVAHGGDFAGINFNPPAGVGIAGFSLWRDMQATGPAAPGADPTTTVFSNSVAIESPCTGSAGCVRGDAASPLAAANKVGRDSIDPPINSVVALANCQRDLTNFPGDPMCPANPSGLPSAVIRVWAADLLLRDDAAPAVSNVSGPLLTGDTLSGPQPVSFDATDSGSGVSTGRILIDGKVAVETVLDANGGACANLGVTPDGRPSYLSMKPCRSTLKGQLTLDTDSLAPGAHALNVSVADAAGNETAVAAKSISVVGSRTVPNGAGASRAAKLTARLAGARRGVRRLGFRTRATLTGRLVNEGGRPIVAAAVEIMARERRVGAATTRVATATTGADGGFRVQLNSGPSRTITVRYTAFNGDPKPSASVRMRTAVRASLTGSIVPRSPRIGRPLRFSGRLRYLPRSGVAVTIQVRETGGWRTFDTVKTRKRGRYRWTHRFRSANLAGRRVLFRARVDSPIYPFATGTSRPVAARFR